MQRVTTGIFGKVQIDELPPHKPPHYQRLDWSHEGVIDSTIDNKLWLLSEAVNADFGYIDGDKYIVFSDNSDDTIDEEPFCSFLSISIPQNCELDFEVARDILNVLWSLTVDAYQLGYSDALKE